MWSRFWSKDHLGKFLPVNMQNPVRHGHRTIEIMLDHQHGSSVFPHILNHGRTNALHRGLIQFPQEFVSQQHAWALSKSASCRDTPLLPTGKFPDWHVEFLSEAELNNGVLGTRSCFCRKGPKSRRCASECPHEDVVLNACVSYQPQPLRDVSQFAALSR